MSFRPAMAIALLLLAIALPVRADEEYPDGGTVSFQELTSHASAYYGKTMHVRGVLNQCTYANCQLCPDWSHLDQCIDVGGWWYGRESKLYRELYRFSEAIFTVVVSPNPYLRPNPNVEMECISPIRLCYSEIGLINAEKLIDRKPSPMVNIPSKKLEATDNASLRAAFPAYADAETETLKFFLLDDKRGFLCERRDIYSQLDERRLLWPTKEVDLLPNLANPYRCFMAYKDNPQEAWVALSELSDVEDNSLLGIE